MKAIILKADGTTPFIEDVPGDLESIKAVVEGWIERVPSVYADIDPKITVYANEEGLIQNLPPNRNIIAIRALGLPQAVYAGNLIVLGSGDEEGNETDVPQEIIDLIVPKGYMTESDEPVQA